MAKPEYQRPRTSKLGKFCEWPEDADEPEEVAKRVTYTGNPIHKTYPSPAGPPAWRKRADKTKCDHFASAEWPQLLCALREAIRAGSVGGGFKGGFPRRVWAWINETLHEARLTAKGNGDYHGFPLDDPRHYPTPVERLKDAPRVTVPHA